MFVVPHPKGAEMNLLIIWLTASVVCTGFVLLLIRFAPRWEDEPLDTIEGCSERSQDGPRDVTERRTEIHKVHSSRRTNVAAPGPKLANFAITRSEEPLA
jgi:hypothetical protein